MSRAGLAGAAAAIALAYLGLGAPALAADPTPPPPPSAIGDASVFWIAVSPAYARTGLVLAMATPMSNCSDTQSCTRLFVSHDGGSSWAQSPASGWNQGRPVVAVNGAGREVVFAATSNGMQESLDQGASWRPVGGPGALPAISPTFARDATVAVGSGNNHGDYLLRGSSAQGVTGSGGTLVDLGYALSPAYPSGGVFPPALLSGADGNGLPVIQRCTASLTCSGATRLAGAVSFSAPVNLLPAGDYPTSGAVFAQSGRGVYKSLDGGTSFAPLTIFNGEDSGTTATPAVALAPGYRERGSVRTLYTSVFSVHINIDNPSTSGGLYRSDDGGASWRRVGSPSPLDGGSTTVAIAPDGRIFAAYLGTGDAGTHGGLLCSTDGGSSWHVSCPVVGGSATAGHTGAGTAPSAGAAGAGASPVAVASPCFGPGCPSPSPTPGADPAAPGATAGGGGMPGGILAGLAAAAAALLIGAGAYYWFRVRPSPPT